MKSLAIRLAIQEQSANKKFSRLDECSEPLKKDIEEKVDPGIQRQGFGGIRSYLFTFLHETSESSLKAMGIDKNKL